MFIRNSLQYIDMTKMSQSAHVSKSVINNILYMKGKTVEIDRESLDRLIKAADRILNSKEIIGIFPEGTINRTENDIIPFKKGAIKMSLESKSYIIPFAINGIYEKNKISVIFGAKYYPKTKDIETETKELENQVKELLKKVRK